jgi:predicted AAA+ superfamily ATPase
MTEEQLRRLLQLVAFSHGQYWNHAEAGLIIGVSNKTVQRHLELYQGAYILRQLPPYGLNLQKRLRKAPKIYLRDSGLLHALLMLRDAHQLAAHPRYGASWEGFCIEQIIRLAGAREEECFTWSIHGGAEVDLVVQKSGGLAGFEFKASDAPRRTASMITASQELGLTRLYVVYPGATDYPLGERIEAVGFQNLHRIFQ